jgi:hypothetical protein
MLTCVVENSVLKPFKNFSSYISQEAASGGDANPGFSIFPAPGRPSGDSNASAPAQSASAQPTPSFSGRGVVLGSVAGQGMVGYQGSANAPSTQQNVREVSGGPNPLTQNSKLVKDHDAKMKEAKKNKEDLENPDEGDQDSKSEEENIDLLNES